MFRERRKYLTRAVIREIACEILSVTGNRYLETVARVQEFLFMKYYTQNFFIGSLFKQNLEMDSSFMLSITKKRTVRKTKTLINTFPATDAFSLTFGKVNVRFGLIK